MEINIYQILFQILNFGVVMYLLNKVLYKPVMKMLDDRAKKINEGMSQAEKNLKAGEEIEKTKKAEVSKARKEASSIIAAAEVDANGGFCRVSHNNPLRAGRGDCPPNAARARSNPGPRQCFRPCRR